MKSNLMDITTYYIINKFLYCIAGDNVDVTEHVVSRQRNDMYRSRTWIQPTVSITMIYMFYQVVDDRIANANMPTKSMRCK